MTDSYTNRRRGVGIGGKIIDICKGTIRSELVSVEFVIVVEKG